MRGGPKLARLKMRDYRIRLRDAGMRPIQIWVPDVRAKGFAAKLRRQVRALAARHEADVMDFIEATEVEL
jgi:hypothetical protein